MKNIFFTICLLGLVSLMTAAPIVSSVNATQRSDGSKMVDIYYSLVNASNLPMTVMLIASNDNGNTWSINCSIVSGAIGQNVSPGSNKHIVWNAAAEYPNIVCDQFRFKIIAIEGDIAPIPFDQFVYVPGGTFTMGNTLGGGQSNELPLHQVSLSSFLIGKYKVTQAEYQEVMGSNPSQSYGVGSNYPVHDVSWYSVLKYCNLRSIAEGLTPVYSISGTTNPSSWGSVPTSINATWDSAICNFDANGYRLPTEAEWEYAARGAVTSPDYVYAGSNDINAVAWHSGNSGNTTHTVGTKLANSLGIFDMSGNVWEWCWDWYSGYNLDGQINPSGPDSGYSRVLRGGSFGDTASSCRVAYRYSNGPYYAVRSNGFRVCRAIN